MTKRQRVSLALPSTEMRRSHPTKNFSQDRKNILRFLFPFVHRKGKPPYPQPSYTNTQSVTSISPNQHTVGTFSTFHPLSLSPSFFSPFTAILPSLRRARDVRPNFLSLLKCRSGYRSRYGVVIVGGPYNCTPSAVRPTSLGNTGPLGLDTSLQYHFAGDRADGKRTSIQPRSQRGL